MKKYISCCIIFLIVCVFHAFNLSSQNSYKIAVLKYSGGGDWYANPTSLQNLIKFSNENLKTNISNNPAVVEAGSNEIFNYPFVHMTGHGNVIFNEMEIENIRNYLFAGGFIHIDDNYGMDQFVRREILKLFPDKKLQEIATKHPIFNGKYKFPNGLPKIHEHNANSAKAYGITVNGRLVLIYTFESDIGDGWEDQEVHNNSELIRTKALKMGANILDYVFSN